jgi:hypothetical protein
VIGLASPKSRILAEPFTVARMLAGFRSRPFPEAGPQYEQGKEDADC